MNIQKKQTKKNSFFKNFKYELISLLKKMLF